MRTVQEYRQHADECRKFAQSVGEPRWRATLEQMAQTWETLAKMRERDLTTERE
jgi:hypothetical protein